MILAGITFAGMNVCIKAVPNIPSVEIVFFRAVISFVLSLFFVLRKRISPWGTNKKVLLLRGLFGTVALICFFYTLHVMPLASAMVIHYLSPLFTALIAHFALKERLKFATLIFFLISLVGVFIMKGFDPRISWSDALIGLVAAVMSGAAYNSIRKLKFSEDSNVIILYFPMVAFPITGFILWVTHGFVMPTGRELGLLILVGLLTQIAQYFLTRAYQSERADKVASVSNLGVIYALILGYFMFGEVFNLTSLLGMFLVVSGVVLNVIPFNRFAR
ncbi:MAG: DMT family transporter [Bacteroidetes bacterium]|nr:DMT family transporter [Bacteroidota bacterium]